MRRWPNLRLVNNGKTKIERCHIAMDKGGVDDAVTPDGRAMPDANGRHEPSERDVFKLSPIRAFDAKNEDRMTDSCDCPWTYNASTS